MNAESEIVVDYRTGSVVMDAPCQILKERVLREEYVISAEKA